MKKLVNFTDVTRRKLVKVLWDIGSEYYVVTDGSSFDVENGVQRYLEWESKDFLQDILRNVVYQAHVSAFDHMTPLLVCVTTKLTQHGVITPEMYELPTSTGIQLIRASIQKWAAAKTDYLLFS